MGKDIIGKETSAIRPLLLNGLQFFAKELQRLEYQLSGQFPLALPQDQYQAPECPFPQNF